MAGSKREAKKDQESRPARRNLVVPVFTAASVQSALVFKKRLGDLKRPRRAPAVRPNRAPEVEYFRRVNALLKALQRMVAEMVVPQMGRIVGGAPVELREPVRTDVGEVLEEVIGALRFAFQGSAPLETIARNTGADAEKRNAKDQKKIVRTVLGIQPELNEPWLQDMVDQFAKSNARLIGNVTNDFIDRVERRIADRIREGLRPEVIAKEIERDFIRSQGIEAQKAKKRAKLIARDQVASLQGDITKVRQTQLGVSRYIWRTAEDERVRSSHASRNGEIFVWGEPIQPQLRSKGLKVDTIDGHPGKPINCRCYAEPILDDLVPDIPAI